MKLPLYFLAMIVALCGSNAGSTIHLLHAPPASPHGPWVDATPYTHLDNAIQAIDQNRATLLVSQPIDFVQSPLRIPENITLQILQGGAIYIQSGQKLLVEGWIEAGRYQIFTGDGAAMPSSVFMTSAAREVFPEWWAPDTPAGTIPDMTTAINCAIAASETVSFGPVTYAISQQSGQFVLLAATNTSLRGIQGQTTLWLQDAGSAVSMIGSPSKVEFFEMEGVILDGNKNGIGTNSTWGLYFPHILKLRSRSNQYLSMHRSGMKLGHCGPLISSPCDTLAADISSEDDTYADLSEHGIQVYSYYALRVIRGHFFDCQWSVIDTNAWPPGSPPDERTKTSVIDNVIRCGVFEPDFSVLSLMSDDVEVRGNKIYSGGTPGQIVVHDGTMERLRHYTIEGNYLWDSPGHGIRVCADVNSSIIVRGNHIWNPVNNGIQVVWGYPYADNVSPIVATIIAENVIEYGPNAAEQYGWTGEPAGIKLSHAANVNVSGNTIIAPRFAGVEVTDQNCRDIRIAGNIVLNHVGKPPGQSTRYGGGIVIIDQVSRMDNILIDGNLISNFLTGAVGQLPNEFSGGIVIYGRATAEDFTDIAVKNNQITDGYGYGITVTNTQRTVIDHNIVRVRGAHSKNLNIGLNNVDCAAGEAVIGQAIPMLANSQTPAVAGSNVWLWPAGHTSTQIRNLTGGHEGQIVRIIAAADIEIVEGINIILSGRSSYYMQDTDTLTLILQADGKWYELARGENS